MRKNTMMRVAAIALALVTVLTTFVPVTAQAKTIVSYDEVYAKMMETAVTHAMPGDEHNACYYDLSGRKLRPYFDELNGCYQENGLKIYTVFDGSTKTFRKTGAWSILVGGNKKSNNYGIIKFTAPKAGRYKFTLSSKDNVLRGPVIAYETTGNGKKFKDDYKGSDGVFCDKRTGTVKCRNYESNARKYVCSVTLKKGQSVKFHVESSEAFSNYHYQKNTYVGFDFKIEKIK